MALAIEIASTRFESLIHPFFFFFQAVCLDKSLLLGLVHHSVLRHHRLLPVSVGSEHSRQQEVSYNLELDWDRFIQFGDNYFPIGSAFGTFGQTSTFNKPPGAGFTGFGASSAAPPLGGGFGGLGTNTMGLYVEKELILNY